MAAAFLPEDWPSATGAYGNAISFFGVEVPGRSVDYDFRAVAAPAGAAPVGRHHRIPLCPALVRSGLVVCCSMASRSMKMRTALNGPTPEAVPRRSEDPGPLQAAHTPDFPTGYVLIHEKVPDANLDEVAATVRASGPA